MMMMMMMMMIIIISISITMVVLVDADTWDLFILSSSDVLNSIMDKQQLS